MEINPTLKKMKKNASKIKIIAKKEISDLDKSSLILSNL